MSILIKGALLDGAVTDVYIEKKEIRQVGTDLQVQADQVIDGRRKALIPGFVNAHTHAAMSRSVPYFFSSDSIPRQLLKDFGGYCIRLSTSRR